MSERSQTNLWAVIASAYLSLVPAILYLFSLRGSLHAPVRTFANRGIGLAGVYGMDAAAQTHRYVLLITATVILFCTIWALLNWMEQRIQFHGLRSSTRAEKQTIYGLVLLQIMGAVKLSIAGDPVILKINAAFFFFTILCIVSILLKLYAQAKRKESLLHYLSLYPFLQLSFLLPIALIFLYKPILYEEISLDNSDVLLYLLIALILNWIFWQQTKVHDPEKEKALIKRYYVSAIPLFFLPIAIPLSNEIQYSMSRFVEIDPRFLCLILILLLCSSSAFLFYVCRFPSRLSQSPRRIIVAVYLPCLVFAIVIYRFHAQTMTLTNQLGLKMGLLDPFHLGEVLLPFHQWMSFNKIPFIDLLPSHGLRDFIPQFLYCLANGYERNYDVMIWGWLNYVLCYLALYYLLSKIIDPFFSFGFLLIEPYYVHNFYGGAGFPTKNIEFAAPILIAALLVWLFRKISLGRFVVVWLIAALAVLWRPDIGISCLVGVLCIVMLGSRFHGRSFIRQSAISFLIVYGGLFAIFILLVLIKRQEFSYIATNAFYFQKIDAIISNHLFRKYSSLVIVEYVLFPILGIAYVLFSALRCALKRDLRPEQYALTMLAVFSLVYLMRMLHFHTMSIHGFQFLLFPFLGSMLGFHFMAKKRDSKLIFAVVFCMFILISPRTNGNTLLSNGIKFSFMKWNEGSRRITSQVSRPWDLVEFLRTNLSEGQTFYDFTNSPELFVLTDKEFTPFFIGPFYYAVEGLQNAFLARFEELYGNDKIPYVLFRSNTTFDQLLRVDNRYRSFRIAEFIYRKYSPFKLINGYEVWISNERGDDIRASNYSAQATNTFELGYLAYQWGSLDEKDAAAQSPEVALFIGEPTVLSSEPRSFKLPSKIDKSDGNYIHLRIRARRETTVSLGYGESPDPRFKFTVRESEKPLDYIIRVSTQWEWVSSPTERVWLSAERSVLVEKGIVRRGD